MVSSWERNLLGMPQASFASPSQSYGGFDEVNAARARRARDVQKENEQRRLQARDAELSRQSQERLRSSFNTEMFPGSGTGRDYRSQPKTPEEQARSREQFREFAFGPQRRSLIPGVDEAPDWERLVRDWGFSEQEFRLGGRAAMEGRPGAAAGWTGLAMAGAVPFFGWSARGLGKGFLGAARGARALTSPVPGYNPTRATNITPQLSPPPTVPARQFGFDTSPETRQYAHSIFERQGFLNLPQSVDEVAAASLRGNPEYIHIYRGIQPHSSGGVWGSGGSTIPADNLARQLTEGDFYTMYGVHGTGSYWGDATTAAGYAGTGFTSPGILLEAFLPKNANILVQSGSNREWNRIKNAMRAQGHHDVSAYAAAAGYDAVHSMGIYTIVNRSALIVNRNAIDVNVLSGRGRSAPFDPQNLNPREVEIASLRAQGQLRTVDIGGSSTTRPYSSANPWGSAPSPTGPNPQFDPWGTPSPSPRPRPTPPPTGPTPGLPPLRPRPRPTAPPTGPPPGPSRFGSPQFDPWGSAPPPTGPYGSPPTGPPPLGPNPYGTPRPRPRPKNPNDPWS